MSLIAPLRLKETGSWMMVELQGTLHSSAGDDEPLNELTLGQLERNERGRPILRIGSHLLEGKIEKLGRSYGVVQKNRESKSCEVIGIIREKVVFRSRPKPLVRR
eukprot:g4553.t1